MTNTSEQVKQHFNSFNGRFNCVRYIFQTSQGAALEVIDNKTKKHYCQKYARLFHIFSSFTHTFHPKSIQNLQIH